MVGSAHPTMARSQNEPFSVEPSSQVVNDGATFLSLPIRFDGSSAILSRMWPEEEKTQELLIGAKDGDEGAINRLLERHRDALRRLVDMRLDRALQRRVDASDVVQEVLIDANRRLQDYLRNPSMPFHLWLRQIAKDRIIDAHRRHRVAAKRSIDREQPLAVPVGPDRSTMPLMAELCDRELTPAANVARRELEQRFHEALSEMDEQDREIVQMRHLEQLSNSEAATALGLSPPAAGMRYLRAMRRLRAVFADDDGE